MELKDQVFKLDLPMSDIEVIFGLLQEGPFRVVQPILNKIQSMVQSQMAPPQAQAEEVPPVIPPKGAKTEYKE